MKFAWNIVLLASASLVNSQVVVSVSSSSSVLGAVATDTTTTTTSDLTGIAQLEGTWSSKSNAVFTGPVSIPTFCLVYFILS